MEGVTGWEVGILAGAFVFVLICLHNISDKMDKIYEILKDEQDAKKAKERDKNDIYS